MGSPSSTVQGDFFPRQRPVLGDYRQTPEFRGITQNGEEWRIMMEPIKDESGKVKIMHL